MPETLRRILRHGLPAALLLGAVGVAFAQFAGIWFQAEIGDRAAPDEGAELTAALQLRMPLTMAAWGFGIVALFEAVGSLWRTPKAAPMAAPVAPDAEQLLSELLDQAEAAERQRESTSLLHG